MPQNEFFNVGDSLRDRVRGQDPSPGPPKAGAAPDCSACIWPRLSQVSAYLAAGVEDLDTTLNAIVDTAISITHASRGLLVLNAGEGKLEVKVARDKKGESLIIPTVNFSRSIVNKVLETRAPLYVPNVDQDQALKGAASVMSLELTSAMCAPLMQQEIDPLSDLPQQRRKRFRVRSFPDVLGVIYVDSSSISRPLKQEDLEFFKALTHHATAVLVNALLYDQATTDPLSRLYTRRFFELMLREAQRRADHEQLPFSLIMVDIDHFKKVNDTWGHLTGDLVIRSVAGVLKNSVRASDAACSRYGGEEFAVILTDTDAAGAAVVAEKFRKKIEGLLFPSVPELRVTISLGISTYPDHAVDPTEIIKKSDQGLYAAKHGGRNQYRIWGPDLDIEAARTDHLAGVITGEHAQDYRNVWGLMELLTSLDPKKGEPELLKGALTILVEVSGAERGAVLMPGGGHGFTLVYAVQSGSQIKPLTDFEDQWPAQAIETRKTVAADADGRIRRVVPLLGADAELGALFLDAPPEDELREFHPYLLETMAAQLSMALENARLRSRLR